MGNMTISIDENRLRELYSYEQKTIAYIAKYFGCSPDTIHRRLAMYGIIKRGRNVVIPLHELAALYKTKCYSVYTLAKRYNCSHTTISNRLRDLGLLKPVKRNTPTSIKTIDIVRAYKSGNSATFIATTLGISRWKVLEILRQEGIPIRQSHKQVPLDIEVIKQMYEQDKLSTLEIAKFFQVKSCTITARLKEAHVPIRGNHIQIEEARLLSLLAAGNSLCTIARLVGCSYTAVKQRAIALGVTIPKRAWQEHKKHIVYQYKEEGSTLQELATSYGCCPNTIKNLLQREGVRRRLPGVR